MSGQDLLDERAVAAHWDGNAERWAAQLRAGADLYREHFSQPAFLRWVGKVGGKAVLDAGCGEGTVARLLARGGARVAGVDLSPRMVALARAAEEREPLGIRYEVGSFADLTPFADGSFDAVVSFMALMDASDLDRALAAFRRVLRPDGVLTFAVLHPCFTPRGTGWLRDAAGTVTAVTVPGYFDDRPWVDRWGFRASRGEPGEPPFAVPRFPRPVSGYVNAVVAAGFALDRLEEPRPDEAACERLPFLRRWREVAAFMLLVRARPA